jgi:hypothetical protein
LVFSVIAVVNLFMGSAVIASIIWLCFVTFMIRIAIRREGGLREWLISVLDGLAGRRFAAVFPNEEGLPEMQIGFQLFGHRFLQHFIPLNKIESIEWSTGQGTQLAGRDMKDWKVCVWYDHDDPEKSTKKASWQHRKPDQDVLVIGPGRERTRTEAFALSFIDFFREAGARLERGQERQNCFVRSQ